MSDEFWANVQVEGELPETGKTDEQVTETPAESPTEANQTEQPPSPQGGEDKSGVTGESTSDKSNTEDANNLPFNKNPRWIQMVEERDALRKENESLKQSPQPVQPRVPEPQGQTPDVQIPKWFSDLYGDNLEAYKNYQADLDARLEAHEKRQQEREEQKRRAETEETQRWNDWVKTSISNIEQRFDVSLPEKSNERNEFMAYIYKVKPTDDEGNIDFLKGWDEFSEKKELLKLRDLQKNEARKEVAAKTTSNTRAETPKSDFLTAKDLRGKSFRELAR